MSLNVGALDLHDINAKLIYPFVANLGKENWGSCPELKKKSCQKWEKKISEEGVLIPKSKPGRKRSKKETSVALPLIPDGETEATIEAQRKELVVMFNNRSTDFNKDQIADG